MYDSERDWALADEMYEEQRMKELDFIEEYFMHLYRINVDGSRISGRTNYKQGNSYIIKYTLTPYNATITIDIARDLYDKVNKIVRCRDTETLEYYEIDQILEKENII